jgi:ABC-type sugar transport system ATPase subunit
MTLGERVVAMNDGVVQQVETPQRLYRQPANTFVASFIGSPAMNFVEGMLSDGVVEVGPRFSELPEEARRRLRAGRGASSSASGSKASRTPALSRPTAARRSPPRLRSPSSSGPRPARIPASRG